MKSLKNVHKNKDAILISGGPSALHLIKELKHIDRKKYVMFLESKALTKYFVDYGVVPDYYLLPYPEKSKDNTLQNLIYQSFKVNLDIKHFLKNEYHDQVMELSANRSNLYEEWNLKKGPHKALKYKQDVYLDESPMYYLNKMPQMKIITRKESFDNHFPNLHLSNQFHYFEFNSSNSPKEDFNSYINVLEDGDNCLVNSNSYTNSAAISTFPILKYLGINNTYLFGFDGTMKGVFENNSDVLFKSRYHFYLFLFFCRNAFSHDFKLSFPLYLRPKQDLKDFDNLVEMLDSKISRIETNSKSVARLQNVKDISISYIMRVS